MRQIEEARRSLFAPGFGLPAVAPGADRGKVAAGHARVRRLLDVPAEGLFRGGEIALQLVDYPVQEGRISPAVRFRAGLAEHL